MSVQPDKGTVMINFTNTVHINRTPSEVFVYLSHLENTPEWNWAITETKKTTPGPVAVGTRYRQKRSVPEPATEYLEVTGLEPDRRLEIQGTLARLPARLSYRIRAAGNGSELTNTVRLEPHGSVRLLAPILAARIKRAVADNLNELRIQLEG